MLWVGPEVHWGYPTTSLGVGNIIIVHCGLVCVLSPIQFGDCCRWNCDTMILVIGLAHHNVSHWWAIPLPIDCFCGLAPADFLIKWAIPWKQMTAVGEPHTVISVVGAAHHQVSHLWAIPLPVNFFYGLAPADFLITWAIPWMQMAAVGEPHTVIFVVGSAHHQVNHWWTIPLPVNVFRGLAPADFLITWAIPWKQMAAVG
jgi:hypothetical protein